MKRIIFLLALAMPFFVSAQKTTPGNYTYIGQRYEWLAGVFQALSLPSGNGPAAFTAGQVQRAGAVYFDSSGADKGFYIYDGSAWVLQGSPSAVALPDEIIQPGYVTYSGTGLTFYISPSIYRIDGIIYGTDQDSVTLSTADPDDPRKDVIYLATTGVEVLTGTPAEVATEPQLDAGQLKLTVADLDAGATTPTLDIQVVYDENTESTVSNVGTTTDPNNTANIFKGSKALLVGSLTNGDIIDFDKTGPGLAWDWTNVKSLSFFIKLNATFSNRSITVTLMNGATAVSNEVTVPVDRFNASTWQAISIAVSAFGTPRNYSANRVRIRYRSSVSGHIGFYLDYMHFQDGLTQPGTPGGVSSVDLNFAGWPVTGPSTGAVVKTITGPGTRAQIMRGNATAEPDSGIGKVDPIDTYTKNNDGATINTASKSIGFHLVNSTYNGLMSALQNRQLDTVYNQTVEELSNVGESIMFNIDAFRTGFVRLAEGTNMTIDNQGDSLLIFNSTGGGGSGGLSEIIAGYGLQNVNDSTLDVDSLVIANREWVADRIADVGVGNLNVSRAGTGINTFFVSGDSLYLEDIEGSTYVDVTKTPDSTTHIALPITGTPDGTKYLKDNFSWGTISSAGITTFNTLTDATQTLTMGTTPQTNNLGWVSASGVHTLHVPDASATARGVITTIAQTIAGDKTLSGSTKLTGGFSSNTTTTTGNIGVPSAASASSITTSQFLFAGASTVYARTLFRGSTATTLGVGSSYAGLIIGDQGVTEAGSGTHALLAGAVFKGSAITNAGGATTDLATVYIEGPMTGVTPTAKSYSLWVDAGENRFDGLFNAGGTDLTANQIWGANSGATAMEGKTLTNGQNIKITHGAGTYTFAGASLAKNAMIENPTSTENIYVFRAAVAITISSVNAVLVGSSSPSVTYNIAFGTDRSSGTNVYTSGQTVTSTTAGTAASGVNDNTIPAGSWVWVTTSAQSGTVGQINISIVYTED
jgi:hypothetical protein